MKVKRSFLLVLSGLLAGMAITYGYMKSPSAGRRPLHTVKARVSAGSLITTTRPTMRLFTARVPWIGIVQPQASVQVTVLMAGRIVSIEAKDQAHIERGGPVARLGGTQIEGQHARLNAETESLKMQLGVARQTVKRLKQSLGMQLATKDQVAAAEEAQLKAEASVRDARLRLGIFEKQIYISAPISGIFTNRRVSVGQDVHAGQIVGDIIDSSRLQIAASLFPPQGVTLQGKEAFVRLSQNQILTGRIQRILPQASSTGAVVAWIGGPQIDKHLRPGQTVAGSVAVGAGSRALAVPDSAIVYDSEERSYLFVEKNGAYEHRRVRLGLTQDGWVAVLSGLERNDSVVIQGAYELFYRQFNEQFKVQD